MVAIQSNLFEKRLQLMQQQQIVRSGNYTEQNISLFSDTEGLTPGMMDGSCVDGKDDGKIGFWEGLKSFGKGIVKSFTNMFSSPGNFLKTVVGGIACAGLVAITGGAATPFLIAGGAALGVAQAGKGIYNASKAKTDAEKRAALEDVGGGAAGIATSVIAAKGYTAKTGNALIGKGSLSTYKTAAMDSASAIKMNLGNAAASLRTNGAALAHSVKNDMNVSVMKNEPMPEGALISDRPQLPPPTEEYVVADLGDGMSIIDTPEAAAARRANFDASRYGSNNSEIIDVDFNSFEVNSNAQNNFALSEYNQPSSNSNVFSGEVIDTPNMKVDHIATAKYRASAISSDIKDFVHAMKADGSKSVGEMISALQAKGVDKAMAMKLVTSSTVTMNNMVDNSEFETVREFGY